MSPANVLRMRLVDYRKQAGLSQARFAEILTAAGHPATQGLISQWEAGSVSIPAERCAQVEAVTAGLVSRAELRPDLFGSLLAQAEGSADLSEARDAA